VALFNAIAKSKRDAEEEQHVDSDDDANESKDKRKIDIKEIAKNNFLEMINSSSTSVKKATVPEDDEKKLKKWTVISDEPLLKNTNKATLKVS
jgi:hypothetical protein